MTYHIGRYTNYSPGDASYLEHLQEQYGSQLQKISVNEKLQLISIIAQHRSNQAHGFQKLMIQELGQEICANLSPSDLDGLMEAMIAQIRYGQNNTLHQEEQCQPRQ